LGLVGCELPLAEIRVHITGSIYLILVAAAAWMGWTQFENERTMPSLADSRKAR